MYPTKSHHTPRRKHKFISPMKIENHPTIIQFILLFYLNARVAFMCGVDVWCCAALFYRYCAYVPGVYIKHLFYIHSSRVYISGSVECPSRRRGRRRQRHNAGAPFAYDRAVVVDVVAGAENCICGGVWCVAVYLVWCVFVFVCTPVFPIAHGNKNGTVKFIYKAVDRLANSVRLTVIGDQFASYTTSTTTLLYTFLRHTWCFSVLACGFVLFCCDARCLCVIRFQ